MAPIEESTVRRYLNGIDMSNVSVGERTGVQLTTGTRNVLLGAFAGEKLTTGANNTIIGGYTAATNPSMTDAVVLANAHGHAAARWLPQLGHVAVLDGRDVDTENDPTGTKNVRAVWKPDGSFQLNDNSGAERLRIDAGGIELRTDGTADPLCRWSPQWGERRFLYTLGDMPTPDDLARHEVVSMLDPVQGTLVHVVKRDDDTLTTITTADATDMSVLAARVAQSMFTEPEQPEQHGLVTVTTDGEGKPVAAALKNVTTAGPLTWTEADGLVTLTNTSSITAAPGLPATPEDEATQQLTSVLMPQTPEEAAAGTVVTKLIGAVDGVALDLSESGRILLRSAVQVVDANPTDEQLTAAGLVRGSLKTLLEPSGTAGVFQTRMLAAGAGVVIQEVDGGVIQIAASLDVGDVGDILDNTIKLTGPHDAEDLPLHGDKTSLVYAGQGTHMQIKNITGEADNLEIDDSGDGLLTFRMRARLASDLDAQADPDGVDLFDGAAAPGSLKLKYLKGVQGVRVTVVDQCIQLAAEAPAPFCVVRPADVVATTGQFRLDNEYSAAAVTYNVRSIPFIPLALRYSPRADVPNGAGIGSFLASVYGVPTDRVHGFDMDLTIVGDDVPELALAVATSDTHTYQSTVPAGTGTRTVRLAFADGPALVTCFDGTKRPRFGSADVPALFLEVTENAGSDVVAPFHITALRLLWFAATP